MLLADKHTGVLVVAFACREAALLPYFGARSASMSVHASVLNRQQTRLLGLAHLCADVGSPWTRRSAA